MRWIQLHCLFQRIDDFVFDRIEAYFYFFLIYLLYSNWTGGYDHMFSLKHVLFYRRIFTIGWKNIEMKGRSFSWGFLYGATT